ncbi:receptor-interacting serine/threonine-protein kinase 2-like isoform X2 [Hippocampus zosterae]|uniref:receptor-interacting serine/threonine-protein kinase 2-like isoform X2 n=1 Tax=Hippocampus zosterae TaxID=109293 RepID=UPI00223E5958|nr:receptor-interacting serine/threonine-protein kinase 2-like isoform X2 [Hippocampus zosterae]
MEPHAATGCVNVGCLTSTLPEIPYQKLTDLYYLSRGGFGTVFKAQHSDWRTTVAIKCLKLDSPFGERERKCLLKEAEVLHKARFNYIIQIFGICNEPEFFCIVTEFMSNGSLDQLLHEKDMYPVLAWPLRLRVLYEIALGVNFLHNMSPPLLHHDLKTQNILLDSEFHVKIADFGLSKWRQLSVSKGSGSIPSEIGGTVIYMPPEEYEPSKSRRAGVKHDMYSYAIIMWEVLSRQIPYDVTNPMKIMFNVLRGMRPDTSYASLSDQIPSRDTLVCLMTCGWTANPDERPSFLKCLIELEPMVRKFTEIDFLVAVLEIKKSKLTQRSSCCSAQPDSEKTAEDETLTKLRDMSRPWPESCTSGSGSCSSQETDMSLPGALTSTNTEPSKEGPPSSVAIDTLELPESLKDPCAASNLNGFQSARPITDLSKSLQTAVPVAEDETQLGALTLHVNCAKPQDNSPPLRSSSPSQGPVGQWMSTRREEIVAQMTEACLNQSLDALLARSMLMREDYELVVNQATRAAKVRQLLDNCHRHGEDFCRVVVHKLHQNKQMGLQPFPNEIVSPTAVLVPSAPPLSVSYNIPRNI